MTNREIMQYDVVIVGAGVAGLCAAIKLRQLSADISVCVLEKGSEVGAHILSGAVIEPCALLELFPDWLERCGNIATPVTQESFKLLFAKLAISLPTPPQMHNKGNFIVSMGMLTRWLAREAEGLGVQIFAGFPAVYFIMEEGKVAGVITGDFGVDKLVLPFLPKSRCWRRAAVARLLSALLSNLGCVSRVIHKPMGWVLRRCGKLSLRSIA